MKIFRMSALGFAFAILGLLVLDWMGRDSVLMTAEGSDDLSRSADPAEAATDDVPIREREDVQAEVASSEATEPGQPAADDTIPAQETRADSPVPDPSDLPQSRQSAPAEADPRMRAVRAQLAQLVESEEEDPAWSAGMESQIYSEISLLPGFTASLINVDCRTMHCVVEVTLPRQSPAARSALTTEIDGHPVFVAAPALDLETVALLFVGGPDELPVFVTYLRRGQNSTTQSTSVAASS